MREALTGFRILLSAAVIAVLALSVSYLVGGTNRYVRSAGSPPTFLFSWGGLGSGNGLFNNSADVDVDLTCPPKTDPTLELEIWNHRKGRYITQEVHT